MNQQWSQRQAQWERFHRWESQSRMVALSASERLAEIGALVDRAAQARRTQPGPPREVDIQGIRLMRRRLAVLSRMR